MDFSKLSDSDLKALSAGDLSKVSDEGLKYMHAQTAEPETPMSASQVALGSLGAGGKLLDLLRGTTTAPLLGLGLEAATGKKVFSGQDYLNAVNPTNLKTFPRASEMYARAGVPEGAKLSDYVPGYAAPNANNPWYQPEKGGALDFSVRGAGGTATDIAIDPLTYLTGGAAGAERAAAEGATGAAVKAAAKGLPLGEAAISGAERAAIKPGILQKLGSLLALTPASSTLKGAGEALYNSTLQPVINQGRKFGKGDIGESLYQAGIYSAKNLPEKTKAVGDIAMRARNEIADMAAQRGGYTSMGEAMAPAMQKISAARSSVDPELQPMADALEQKVQNYLNLEKGTPAVPASTQQVASKILDANGNPVTTTVHVPGVDAVPGRVISPQQGLDFTSSIWKNIPQSGFNEMYKTPLDVEGAMARGAGMRQASLSGIDRSLGKAPASAVEQLNDVYGKFGSTKMGQNTAASQVDRLEHAMVAPTGTDTLGAAILGGGAGAEAALRGALLQKAGYGLRRFTMPIGYGMQSVADSPIPAALMDAYARQKLIQNTTTPAGPWQNVQ